MITRGDIRWFRFARPDKRRPVVVLGRPELMASLSQVVVIPCSTSIRGLPWEVILDKQDGLAVRCTLKVEWIRAVERQDLGPHIATFPGERWGDVRRAVVAGLGLEDEEPGR
jgi:mRNA interferase MazF